MLKVCRKLGCSGYAEMKEVFRHYVGERLKDSFDRSYTLETVDDRSRSDRGALLRSMFEAEQQGITALAASIGEEQIFDCAQTLMNAREVLLFGHDVSKVMADYFAHRLNYLRIKASSLKLGDSDTVKTSLSMANENARRQHQRWCTRLVPHSGEAPRPAVPKKSYHRERRGNRNRLSSCRTSYTATCSGA